MSNMKIDGISSVPCGDSESSSESVIAMEPSPVDAPKPSFIVGLGASAGGLEALERFFSCMPEKSDMAFVVIQHLSPDFRSVMDELLARWTKLPR